MNAPDPSRPVPEVGALLMDVTRDQVGKFRGEWAGRWALRPVGWYARLRALWREGHAGWIIASCVGAFSMATHFGAYWLIAGGGWLGATAITLASTVVMVAICFWIVLGLVESR